MSQKFSRKDFLKNTGKFVLGTTIGASAVTALLGASNGADIPTIPFKYKTIDPDEARKLAYEAKHKMGCGYAGFHGIIGKLQQEVGEPYTHIPTEMMAYGGAGVKGWGTLCGALNGAAAAISLVCDSKTSTVIINELFQWYTETKFPTDRSNQYASNGTYSTKGVTAELLQSVSGSPLCHVSVTKWCNESGMAIGSKEQNERCVRLSADVVGKAVELINDHYSGKFVAATSLPSSVPECKSCHGPAGEVKNATGKMDCVQCHEPHE